MGRYLVCMGLSRFLRLMFWILMWIDGDGFFYLILADILHCVFIGDFVYLFITNKNKHEILII